MRISYICNVNLADANAGTIHVLAVAEGLARRGHRVRVVAPALGRLPRRTPVEVAYLPLASRRRVTASFNAALLAYLPWLAAAFRPQVCYVRDFPRCVAPPLATRLLRTPLVVEMNGILSAEAARTGVRLRRADAQAQRFCYRSAAAAIAVTDAIRDHAVSEFGVPAERVRVLANGVDVEQFRPLDRCAVRRELGLGDAPVVGFIGHFEAWQGIDALLCAVPHVLAARPETRVLLVGSGPREAEYRALARALGVEHAVTFVGQVPVAESPRWINAFDVAVALKRPLASGYSPLKLYAYLACGRPVVASRVPGFEEVEDEGAGVLIDGDDAAAAARAVLGVLGDPAGAQRMGAAGRRLALARHSWDHVVDETERICRAVSGGER